MQSQLGTSSLVQSRHCQMTVHSPVVIIDAGPSADVSVTMIMKYESEHTRPTDKENNEPLKPMRSEESPRKPRDVKKPMKYYTVIPSKKETHKLTYITGIHHGPWAWVEKKLPTGKLFGSGCMVKGHDTVQEATTYLCYKRLDIQAKDINHFNYVNDA